jgi:hypothetical protein
MSDPIKGNGKSLRKEIKMRTYIVNLTDNLIGEHHLEQMFYGSSSSGEFLKVIDPLILHALQHWSPETLGKVIASVEQLECPSLEIGFMTDTIRYLRILRDSSLKFRQ